MVPIEYRHINYAICLLTDEHYDAREEARAALHALFRQQMHLEHEIELMEEKFAEMA